MTLDQNDLDAIQAILSRQLEPLKDDIKAMKDDLNILARLSQLDDIRKEPRLRKLYASEGQREA